MPALVYIPACVATCMVATLSKCVSLCVCHVHMPTCVYVSGDYTIEVSDLVCVSCVYGCMCAGYRLDISLPCGLSTYFLRQILNVPKMDRWVSLASLGGQCSPGTHLSLPTPSGGVTEMFHCTQLFMRVLAVQTQALSVQQECSQLNHHLHSPK